jgi:hypothetical protein
MLSAPQAQVDGGQQPINPEPLIAELTASVSSLFTMQYNYYAVLPLLSKSEW